MKLLLVAADRMEFRGLLDRVASRPAAVAVDFAREARVGAHEALLVANGVGWKRAAMGVSAAREFMPDAIVSTGFCGAVDPKLGIADVVAATAIAADGVERPCCKLDAPRSGVIASVDHVAGTAEEKRRLHAAGACAVEMEAAGVAAEAARANIPFYCVRAVTDLADETMANDFNLALRPDGHFDTMFILRAALGRPHARLPELIRLRSRCLRASQILGDFIAGCRF